MARTTRSAKQLAQRIDLGYLQRPEPLRRWRLYLSLGATGVALLWVVWLIGAREQKVYSSGPMSRAHSLFSKKCDVCHLAEVGGFVKPVRDTACLECHDGPVHNAGQTFTPTCASCHIEHKGPTPLAQVPVSKCAQCHAALQTKTGAPRFERNIEEFDVYHPEFAVLRLKSKDPGGIKLNHKVHLKKDLKGPRGPVQMDCTDCHRPVGTQQPWPYAQTNLPDTAPHAAPAGANDRKLVRDLMAVPTYANTCAACHTLRFDPRIADQVPHEKPEVVREFVLRKYREYIAKNPRAINEVPQVDRKLPGMPTEFRKPRNSEEWVSQQLGVAETLLWRKTCLECHTLRDLGGSVPQIQPAKITAVWMPHAVFSHERHRVLDCTACHARVVESQETSDVLLPGVATCQQCHRAGEAAENRCFLCHTYHDWGKERETRGKFKLPDLVNPARTQKGQ